MKVSVITITNNRAHLIAETIQSVLAQTYPDYEHIIIDDGSSDNTEDVVKAFHDERIKYFKYQKQSKRSFLRNEAIRKAKGELISILDSDDLWDASKLELVVQKFSENPTVDFIFHNLSFVKNGETIGGPFFPYPTGAVETAFADLLNNAILPYPVWTIRKSALEKIGLLDENMLDGQQDLYLRAGGKLGIYFIGRPLTAMKKHAENISNTIDLTHYKDYLDSLGKLVDLKLITENESLYFKSKVYRKVGSVLRRQGKYFLAAANYTNWIKFRFLKKNSTTNQNLNCAIQ